MKGKSRPVFYSRMPFVISLLNNDEDRVAYMRFRSSRLNDELIVSPDGKILKETADPRHLKSFLDKYDNFEQKFYRYADAVTAKS